MTAERTPRPPGARQESPQYWSVYINGTRIGSVMRTLNGLDRFAQPWTFEASVPRFYASRGVWGSREHAIGALAMYVKRAWHREYAARHTADAAARGDRE